MLVTGTGALAIWLWTHGEVEVGTVAMALPLAWQIVNIAGWVACSVTDIFENIGVVQEGMSAIARPIALTDKPDAAALTVPRGEIEFEDIRFGYGRENGLIDGLSLHRPARARRSAWSAAPAPASPRWSTCCCASSTWRTAAS